MLFVCFFFTFDMFERREKNDSKIFNKCIYASMGVYILDNKVKLYHPPSPWWTIRGIRTSLGGTNFKVLLIVSSRIFQDWHIASSHNIK